MSVRLRLIGWIVIAASFFIAPLGASAATPSERILPAATKGYLSVGHADQLLEHFNRSQFGRLVNDPAMKPFVDDFRMQLRQHGLKQLEQLGLTWDELDGVPTGEVALAVVQLSSDDAAVAMIVDIGGHEEKAQALLTKVTDRLARSGAKRMRQNAGDSTVAYQLAADPNRKQPAVAAYCLQRDLLLASDNLAVLDTMVQAANGTRKDSLENIPAYREIMTRCGGMAGGLAPDLRWFIEPFGYAETVRASTQLRDKRKGPDLLKTFKNQGFGAVQGIGGFVNFSAGKYEMLHRTMVYAPAVGGGQEKEKYRLAARMLNFPAGGDLLPQVWVPRDMATYASFNWDVRTAFSTCGTLVDEIVGEKGVFRDVLDSLRDDPTGPRVDIEKHLIANLGTRATIVSDYELPIGPKSERKVVAIEITNEPLVATTIRKLMESDKDAHLREVAGHLVWQMIPTKSTVPTLEIEAPSGAFNVSTAEPTPHRSEREDRLVSAVCVANGHLYLASHVELLERVLTGSKPADRLGAADDFRLIAAQASTIGNAPLSFRMFSRSDQEIRPTYELIRTGQMPQSETILGTVLNSVLGEGKDGLPRKQRIDGHLLPEFDVVRRYFGPAGTFVTSLDDGWMCVGLMLSPETVVAEAPRIPQAPQKTESTKVEVGGRKSEVGGAQAEQARAARGQTR